MTPKRMLVFGSTGYIGGTVLSQLHAKYGSALSDYYRIALAGRSLEKLNKIEAILAGSQAIELGLQDHAKIEKEVQKHDIVCQIADCDDLGATRAILKGLKARKEATGMTPTLYQTSGADLGGHPSGVVTSDLDSDKINAIPVDVPHRNVDDAVVRADEAGYIRSYILVPSAVYGNPSGIIHDKGLANSDTMGVKAIVQPALIRRAVGQVGPGENLWSIVHVDDVAALHLELLENPPSSHGRDGFYNAEHGSVPFCVAAEASAKTLYSLGLVDTDKPTLYTAEEVDRFKVRYTLMLNWFSK